MALAGQLIAGVGIQTPAAKFFNHFANQLHHVQNVTERVHHTKLHHGDDWHSNDTVKLWTYIIDGKTVTCKEKIETIDKQNYSATYHLFDGDISPHFKTFKFHFQVTDKAGGGAVAQWTIEYEKVNEDVATPNGYVDYITKVTKDVDAHLLNA